MAVRITESPTPLFQQHDSPFVSTEADGLETTTDLDARDGEEQECLLDLPAELQDFKSNAILLAQGHKAAMQRSFSPFAALGLGFRCVSPVTKETSHAKKCPLIDGCGSITNSWVGYLSCFGQNLAYAGPNSVIFGLLAAAVIQWTISLGLSEIASCFPSSGVCGNDNCHMLHMLSLPSRDSIISSSYWPLKGARSSPPLLSAG